MAFSYFCPVPCVSLCLWSLPVVHTKIISIYMYLTWLRKCESSDKLDSAREMQFPLTWQDSKFDWEVCENVNEWMKREWMKAVSTHTYSVTCCYLQLQMESLNREAVLHRPHNDQTTRSREGVCTSPSLSLSQTHTGFGCDGCWLIGLYGLVITHNYCSLGPVCGYDRHVTVATLAKLVILSTP